MSMSDKEISEILDTIGIPYAYHHFEDSVSPPFLIYVDEPPTHIMADGVIYMSIRNITLELYSDTKDSALIKQVEDMFIHNEIRYQKEEDWIESEGMFEFAFMVQI